MSIIYQNIRLESRDNKISVKFKNTNNKKKKGENPANKRAYDRMCITHALPGCFLHVLSKSTASSVLKFELSIFL